MGEIRVVHGGGGVGAAVENRTALFSEPKRQPFFESETAMIGTDSHVGTSLVPNLGRFGLRGRRAWFTGTGILVQQPVDDAGDHVTHFFTAGPTGYPILGRHLPTLPRAETSYRG
jgi:hypothetical protein